MLSLSDLRQKLKPVKDLSILTCEVEIGEGYKISMRLLQPDEETEAMFWAREVIEENDNESGNDMIIAQYYDRFRRATLAKSIYAINGEILGDMIETDEVMPNGTKRKVQTHMAMRDEIATWGRAMIERVFAKYGELIVDSETRAKDAIKLEPLDLDEEIERIKTVLEDLERQRDDRKQDALEFRNKHVDAAKKTSTVVGDQVKSAVNVPQEVRPAPQKASKEVSEPAPVQYAAPPMERAPVQQHPAPQREHYPRQAPQHFEEDDRAFVPSPSRGTRPEADWADSSFVNTSDQDSIQAEIQRENERQQRLRARRAEMQRASAAPLPQRVPPHAGAMQAAQQMPPTPQNEPVNGGDYAMRQDVIIGQRRHKGKIDASVVDQPSRRGATNPKFRPRKKR